MKLNVIGKNLIIMKIRIALLCALMLASLSGCEELGIPDPEKEAARKQAEGEAIGSACRHAGRALEDCFERNPRASKAAIFAGWRSMNDYMTENNIATVPPEKPEPVAEGDARMPAESDRSANERKGDQHSRRIDLSRRHG